jgi:hypothetical protein
MNDCNSTFTYFITSVNNVSGGECNDCLIDLGPIGENYDSYYCRCIAFNMNVDTLVANGPTLYYLVADDLAENGYNTHAAGTESLTNRQCVLGWMTNDTDGSMNTGEGAHFIIKNLRQKRRIRFRLYNEQFIPADGTYVQAATVWSCVLLLKPIA